MTLPRPARHLNALVLLLCLSGLGLFAFIGDEIREGENWRLDSAVLLALRRPDNLSVPIGPKWLEQSAIDASALGGFTLVWFLSIAVVVFLLVIRRRTEAALLAAAFTGSALLNAGLKLLFHRPRPEVVPHLTQVSNDSFPSGHAMISAATYLTIGVLLAHTQSRLAAKVYLVALAIVLVVAVGLSRLYLGVHWPSDVMAGWSVGSAWAIGVSMLAQARAGPGPSDGDDNRGPRT